MPKSAPSQPASGKQSVKCQTALVTRIALFLKILSKENFQKLLRDTAGMDIPSEGDLLKLMISKAYISPKEVPGLKKTCLSFARAQTDTRFGSLCIEFGFLTQSNLDLALEEQKFLSEDGRTIFLGDLLVEAGMISAQQQKLILQKQKMDLNFQENTPQNATREIRGNGIILFIPETGLRAHGLREKTVAGSPLSVDRLKDFLEDNGIIYGLKNDYELKKFLSDDLYTAQRFELAKGLDPIPGTDAQIFYLFEQNYLTAGHLNNNGTMDFKSRGQVPFVAAGDILAEKIPAKDGRDGVDIFGDVVESVPPMDAELLCGKGVSLSENNLRAYADREGYPKLSPGGSISVNDAHVIRGDVDFTTGHVKFNKNVFITGTVKSGFKVEAVDVVARAVDGGIISAKGDVSIALGITNATIDAEGSVSAGFVHRSTIGAMGDVDITTEVVESQISLEGTFEMSRGKMYASTVSARGGAKVYHIGSIKTVPTIIEVGTSPYLNRAVKALDLEIDTTETRLEAKIDETDALQNRINEVEREITRLNKEARSKGGPKAQDPEALNTRLSALRTEQNTLDSQIRSNAEAIEGLKQLIKTLVERKFNLQHKIAATLPKPILDVRGMVLSGTMVRGVHSSTCIAKDLARVRIMEMISTEQRDGRAWEMITNRL